jgi:membrane protein
MLARWRGILWQTVADWWEDKAPRLGAALAYYTVLSLAPVVILVTPVAGLLFREKGPDARAEVVGEMAGLVGHEGARALRSVLSDAQIQAAKSPVTRVITVLVLLFAASAVFAELQDALDTIWEVAPKPGRTAVWSFVRTRLLSFAMVLGVGFLLVVSLIFSAGLGVLREYADERFAKLAWLWTALDTGLSLVLITVLFAMIFKVLPDVNLEWRDVWLGAALTSALFAVGRVLIGAYLGRASVGAGYGAAAQSLVVLLVWVYYSSQILLLGAEFTKVYSKRSGSKVTPTADAVPVTNEARAQAGITKKEVVEAVKEVVEKKEAERGEGSN